MQRRLAVEGALASERWLTANERRHPFGVADRRGRKDVDRDATAEQDRDHVRASLNGRERDRRHAGRDRRRQVRPPRKQKLHDRGLAAQRRNRKGVETASPQPFVLTLGSEPLGVGVEGRGDRGHITTPDPVEKVCELHDLLLPSWTSDSAAPSQHLPHPSFVSRRGQPRSQASSRLVQALLDRAQRDLQKLAHFLVREIAHVPERDDRPIGIRQRLNRGQEQVLEVQVGNVPG